MFDNKKHLNYCKENGIGITGPALGRPKKNITRAEKIESMLIHAREMKLDVILCRFFNCYFLKYNMKI